MAKKRCTICGRWFIPNPRTVKTQKACDDPACRRARKRQADKAWLAKNPGWTAGRKIKIRNWNRDYPAYWRRYRAEHPQYCRKERERMARNRVLRVAKQDAIRQNPVGYLREVRGLGPKIVAKQDAISQRLDGVLDYLTVCARAAKQDGMACRAGRC
jgi:hypothetical protein